ncbi:ATPase, histidine kinase-, DNA gyrase B, putative (macronuclear) [Tetrahymena thermophila SB210]|uniref:ATPase, histidine kinase-, DNA gyrase B, putative n=1 Tax=Tetrahymena thermophila (strain SB210) TaxID=312017 RepID=Q22D33_TETTS|nr:ATPase, histidine kinase-, DNA gyrase B, putative [Tetrahymena thermophila SB210]EAR83220.2 ATPase, histidine kinase-, DNA gyrase B, putative [Tetrahymena thermophila SB210]|eukprot:XP_001030883.2 ATPase, histidine kinase-, DNA gyrase B, putative [Tetrahymena thermophila SB210]
MGKRAQIKKQITKLDMFGQKIGLLYKEKPQHLTFFGGFISLLNAGLFIFVAYSYGAELFLKQNPVTNFSEESLRQPEQYIMTHQTFSMAFGMQDPNTFDQFIDESIYSIKVIASQMIKVYNQTTGQYDQVWSEEDLGPYPCKLSDFQVEGSLEYFQQLSGLDQMYCFDQSDGKASIAGDFEADFFQVLDFSVYQCQNKTDEEAAQLIKNGQKVVVCKSQEDIDSVLMNGYFAAYYTDKVINPKLRDNPFTTFPRDIFWPTSNKLVKELTMYWRNVYIESDMGIINEDIQILRDVTFSYSTEQLTYGQNNKFVHMIVRFEKAKQSRYFRSYMKIQDVLAQISGVMSLFMVISAFICSKISKLDLSQSLVNEVFSFQSLEDEIQEQNIMKEQKNEKTQKLVKKFTNRLVELKKNREKQQLSPISNQNKEQLSFSQHIRSFDQQTPSENNSQNRKKEHSEIISQFIKNYKREISLKPQEKEEKMEENLISKLFKATHQVIHLYYFDYFLYYIFPCFKTISRKKKQIEYSQKILDKHLDVMYLITKLLEIDKLKMLLLSEDQIKLFNYLPKPTIRESEVFKQEQKCQKVGGKDNQENQPQQDIDQANQNKKYLQIEKFNLLYMDDRTEIQKAADAYSAFNSLKKHQQRTEIDTKLLMMLDPKILDCFLDENEIKQYHNTLNTQLSESQQLKQQPSSPLSKFSSIIQNLRVKQLSQFSPNKEDNDQSLFNKNDENYILNFQSSPVSSQINQEGQLEDVIIESTNNNLLQSFNNKAFQQQNKDFNQKGDKNNYLPQYNLNYQFKEDKLEVPSKKNCTDYKEIDLEIISDIKIPLEEQNPIQQNSFIPDSKQIRVKKFTTTKSQQQDK